MGNTYAHMERAYRARDAPIRNTTINQRQPHANTRLLEGRLSTGEGGVQGTFQAQTLVPTPTRHLRSNFSCLNFFIHMPPFFHFFSSVRVTGEAFLYNREPMKPCQYLYFVVGPPCFSGVEQGRPLTAVVLVTRLFLTTTATHHRFLKFEPF